MTQINEARYGRACLFVLNVCPFTLRHVIDYYYTKQGSPDIQDFLEKNKHDLYHIMTKKCCCRRVQSHFTPMYRSQWDLLYTRNRSPCRGTYSAGGDCPCKFDPIPGITSNVMDITLCCLVIKNICQGPGINMIHIDKIRDIRNKLIHASSATLDEPTYNGYWSDVKTAILDLANSVSPTVHTDTLKMLEDLEKRVMNRYELEETRKVIVDQKKLEERVSDVERDLEETNKSIVRVYGKVRKLEGNVTQRVTALEENVKQTAKEMTKMGETLYSRSESSSRKISEQRDGIGIDEEPDVRRLKQRLIKVTNDLTKVITLSPLQERGRELPIELLFSQVVIREDQKKREKGDNSGIDTSKQLPVRDCGLDMNTGWKSETDSNTDYKSFSHSRRSFLETLSEDKKELLNPYDIFKAEDEVSNSIYMLGDAAHGKTTYCLWLAKKWCNAQQEDSLGRELDVWETALKEFDFVFLLQFRNVNPNRASVVDMICHDVSRSLKGCHAAIRHVLSSEKYRSLVIMDGLDEWNPNEETRKQLTCQGMPNLEELSSTLTTFISMRPWVFALISKLVQGNDIVTEILGLSETGMDNVIKNVLINRYELTENSSEFNDIYNRIRMNLNKESLKSFMQIPLLAVVCVQIWFEGKQIGDSTTSFYAEMLDMLIERASGKHKLEIEQEELIDYRLPELLSRQENVRSYISVLFKLGKVAYEGLISKETYLVFQKRKLEKEIGERDLQFTLDVGLMSRKEAPSLLKKNVSVHFFHKSIQEFLAVIYIITNKEVGDSFCKHLSSVQVIMELSNVIMFICGMCPSLGSVISQHVVSVTDSDTTICRYRELPGPDSSAEGLCEIQIGWYRELQDRETESPVTFHISDVCHNGDVETMSVIRKIFSDHNVLGIRSLYLYKNARLGVPTVSESSITNTELNDFLLNKHNNTRSLIKVCISGHYCVPTISIPTLRNLHLIHVSIDNSHLDVDICPPFFTHVSSLRVLRLFNVTVGNRGLDISELTSLCELHLTSMTLCDRGLDLSAMTSLQQLSLFRVPLGERGLYLSTNMVNLKEVDLRYEVMSAAQWEQFILSAINIQHRFDLVLRNTNIDDESITRIRSSPHFIVTKEERYTSVGGNDEHTFFFTRVTRYDDDDGNEILYTRLQEKPNITQ